MTYGHISDVCQNAFKYATQRKIKALNRLFGLIHQSIADVNQFFTS